MSLQFMTSQQIMLNKCFFSVFKHQSTATNELSAIANS